MKNLKHLFIILFFFLLADRAFCDQFISVKTVIDGDTIVLENNITVRYIGINAPEVETKEKQQEPFGQEAQAFNRTLVLSGKIRLEQDIEKDDQFGRRLAYVYLTNGLFANQEILKKGLAYVLYHPPNIKYSGLLLNAQQQAMAEKKGMWNNLREAPQDYIGNKNSMRFHLMSCASAQSTSKKNQVVLKKKWDAFWQGYAPCKKCLGQAKWME